MYGVVCLGRLEKGCLMGLFLTMAANGSNSAMMALNGPNFSLGSLEEVLFRIGESEQSQNSLSMHFLEKSV